MNKINVLAILIALVLFVSAVSSVSVYVNGSLTKDYYSSGAGSGSGYSLTYTYTKDASYTGAAQKWAGVIIDEYFKQDFDESGDPVGPPGINFGIRQNFVGNILNVINIAEDGTQTVTISSSPYDTGNSTGQTNSFEPNTSDESCSGDFWERLNATEMINLDDLYAYLDVSYNGTCGETLWNASCCSIQPESCNSDTPDPNIHCDAGEVCLYDNCLDNDAPTCNNNDDCDFGFGIEQQYCSSGQCTPTPTPPACTENSDCTTGDVCINNICDNPFPPCTIPSDCPNTFICADNKCVLPGCGNGYQEDGEECEINVTCDIAGRPEDTECNSDCVCEAPSGTGPQCGDGDLSYPEECDPGSCWLRGFPCLDPGEWSSLAHCTYSGGQPCQCEEGYIPSFRPWFPYSGDPANHYGWCVPDGCGNNKLEPEKGEECDLVWNYLLQAVPPTFSELHCVPPAIGNLSQCKCESGYVPGGIAGGCRPETDTDLCWDNVLDEGEQCESGIPCNPSAFPGELGPEDLVCISCLCYQDLLPQNSILEHKGDWDESTITADFTCKETTNAATLRVVLDNEVVTSQSGIMCSKNGSQQTISGNFKKNNLYEIELEIPKLCKVCEREFFLSSTGRGWLNKGDINIPDNNLLLVVLIGFVSFAIIAVKKKEE